MQLAAELGFLDILQMLLGYPVDVNRRDITGATALHCAARNGRVACVEALLAHSPRLTRDGHGRVAGDAELFADFVDAETREAVVKLINRCVCA